MTVCTILVVTIAATVFGVVAISRMEKHSAEQILTLQCDAGEKNLDHYFDSVEQSVAMLSAYVESELDGIDDASLQAHLDQVSEIFGKLAQETVGVCTYYYRIDPLVSVNAKGFWFTNLDGRGFVEHEPTDITQYDTNDTSQLVWFTVPKATGMGLWLPPYITDNLDVRVISYNAPIYYQKTFVGVIGIEIDYTTMARQIDAITLYDSGYAFLSDADGNVVYHPHMDVTVMDEKPKIPDELYGAKGFANYTYEGVEKQAISMPLDNGMYLNITVPVKEINAVWQEWTVEIILIFTAMTILAVIIIMRFIGHITRPLRNLTRVAEQINEGKYESNIEYNGKDEVGVLTQTFNKLTEHLKAYIGDLNDLAYADALTALHNKGAFDICVQGIQTKLIQPGPLEFAVCIFDCNDLKKVNDQNGHDKGDIYLKETAAIISEVFGHSPIFRIGGDEFAAVLLGNDFKKRDKLLELFDEICATKRDTADVCWERVNVARGLAVYDPERDETVSDVIRRADRLMYENKWASKEALKKETEGENYRPEDADGGFDE